MVSISSFPSPIQHSIRGEHQLQVIDFDSRRRQNSKLEPDQCPNLLQLLAARVLLGVTHHEDAGQGAEPEDYIEAAKDLDIDQSVKFR